VNILPSYYTIAPDKSCHFSEEYAIFFSLPSHQALRLAFPLPIIMNASQVLASEVSRADLTESLIRSWGPITLLKWIENHMPFALTDHDKEMFKKENITGNAFLDDPSKKSFRDAGLSHGASVELAKLAMEIIGRESKFYFPVTNIASLPCYKSRLLVREVSHISHSY
jgi:hypothetical protein